MNKFMFWQKWLFVVALIVAVFGTVIALFGGTALFELFDRQINPVFWGTANIDDDTRAFQQWNYGVAGGVIAGWGVTLAFIAQYPFRNREKWAWNSLLIGLLVWFVIDTSISLKFQVYFNALFNTVFLVLILLPLVMTRKEMRDQRNDSQPD